MFAPSTSHPVISSIRRKQPSTPHRFIITAFSLQPQSFVMAPQKLRRFLSAVPGPSECSARTHCINSGSDGKPASRIAFAAREQVTPLTSRGFRLLRQAIQALSSISTGRPHKVEDTMQRPSTAKPQSTDIQSLQLKRSRIRASLHASDTRSLCSQHRSKHCHRSPCSL